MEIVYRKIEDLHGYENNPRKNQKAVQPVANSIEEFGFKVPMVIKEDGTVITGHTRLEAAKQIGMEEVPCIIADDLTDEQIKAFRLVDNKVAEFAEWDFDALEQELNELEDMELDFDMSDFGFSDGEFEPIEEESDGPDIDDIYSKALGRVNYEPGDSNWKPQDLYEYNCEELEDEIEEIEDEELKKMLRMRLSWFADFNFARVADYYAYQASEQEQRVFEKLGLVLLDRDGLIKNGFADIVDYVLSDENSDE